MNFSILCVRRLFAVVYVVCIQFSHAADAVDTVKSTPESSVALSSTNRYILHSEAIDQSFRIDVGMPLELVPGGVEKYPVVYVLDGNITFPIVHSNSRYMQTGVEIAPVIVVGIGYETENPLEIAALRARDMTPTYNAEFHAQSSSSPLPVAVDVRSGGAEAFFQFIEESVKPLIHENFPVDEDSETLAGYSLGGLFATYVLLNHPDAFDKYVAGSPSLQWDNAVIFEQEQTYSEAHDNLSATVFLSAGSLEGEEMRENARSMHDVLHSRNYADLIAEHIEFSGESHVSGIGVSLNRGLKLVHQQETAAYAARIMSILSRGQ